MDVVLLGGRAEGQSCFTTTPFCRGRALGTRNEIEHSFPESTQSSRVALIICPGAGWGGQGKHLDEGRSVV